MGFNTTCRIVCAFTG